MWVDYLWITLRVSWAQAGQGLGITGQNALLDLVDEGEREGLRFATRFGLTDRCGKLVESRLRRRVLDLDAARGGADPRRDLLALAVGVLEHRHRPLKLVLQDVLEHVEVAFDVDERRLHLLHVNGPGELEVELVQGEQVRQRHAVADDHDVLLVGVDDGAAADVVRRVGDDRESEWRSRLRVDVLADLADPPRDLALDLGRELGAARRVERRAGQLLERAAGDPFRVDREELAARQPQPELDHLAADPDVPLQHLGRQVLEHLLEDLFAGGATRGAARDDVLEALQA